MRSKRINILTVIFILFIHHVCGQRLHIETIIKEVNRQIFNTDNQGPGNWTLTNKYHEVNFGNVKAETIIYPNDEKVFRQFDLFGNMVKYEVYRDGKLDDDFAYTYAENGVSLLKERGTYNLDYFSIDSNNYIGVNTLGAGIGFTFDLDTLFVSESKYDYELTRKMKSRNKTVDRYEFQFTKNNSLLSISIYENDVQIGHVLNKYNDSNQVIERQDFHEYSRFAIEDEWSMFINNRVYKFQYDTSGFIQSLITETYKPGDRKWETEVEVFECSLQQEGNNYIGICKTDNENYFKVEIDYHGNWIRKEDHTNGEIRVTTREITYYE